MFHQHIFDLTTNLTYNQVFRTYSVHKSGSTCIRQVLHSSQNAYNSEGLGECRKINGKGMTEQPLKGKGVPLRAMKAFKL